MPTIDGRYELLEVIASGGMATVTRARDTRLNRLVAIKRPHPGPPGNNLPERMSREARTAASLSHPNLVTIYDYGSDDDGPYLVMELVEGPTLQEAAETIGFEEALDIGARLADALAAIHEVGIVHRDVKPSNVIMSPLGPVLTDFGLALDPADSRDMTNPGTVVATPSYAAPEVLAGRPSTAASDVFSLAMVIDHLVRRWISDSDELAGFLGTAIAANPEDRPDAQTMARVLRATAPTVTLEIEDLSRDTASPEGSTRILPIVEQPDDDGPPASRRRLVWIVAAMLGLTAIALAVLALDPATQNAEAADPTFAPTTVIAATTTPPPTTAPPTTSSPTTLSPDEVPLDEARSRLEAILLEEPRSDMKPPDVKKLMKKVDEAVRLVEEGKDSKATEKLNEVARQLEKKLDGANREEAFAALESIASSLGLSLDTPDGDDD